MKQKTRQGDRDKPATRRRSDVLRQARSSPGGQAGLEINGPTLGNQLVLSRLSAGSASRPAYTRSGRTTLQEDALRRSDLTHILAHEAVHRAQYEARGRKPPGSRLELEADANAGVTASANDHDYEPRFSVSDSVTLGWCPPGSECVEYPADFIGPLPEGAVRAPPENAEVVQIPESDVVPPASNDFVVAIANDRMAVLPAAGNYVQFRVPTAAPEAAPAERPLVTMPTLGKNAMRVVNVGSRTGFALDAGGKPSVVFPAAMSQIQSTLDVSSISGVLILHIHRDHVESLRELVIRHEISPENIRVPEAFIANPNAPGSDLARTMRALEAHFGPTARFGTIETPTASEGVFHTTFTEGDVRFDIYGLTGAFRELQSRRVRNQEAGTVADTASLLVRATHAPSGTAVLFLGDLRGENLAEFRNNMTADEYSRMLEGVRVVSGFQHHMGALESSADRAGLVEFLTNTLVANRGLSLVIQSQERYSGRQFLNRSLIEALTRVGVNVHVAGEPMAGGGATTIMTDASVTTTGTSVESFPAASGMETHLRRLDRLVEAYEILSTQRHNVPNGEELFRRVAAARAELENALSEYVRTAIEGVGTGARGRRSPTLTNEAAMTRALQRVEGEQSVEQELSLGPTMQNLREIRRLGPHFDTFMQELERARRTGRMSEAGIEALWQLNPEEAQRLATTSGLPSREIRRMRQQIPGAPMPAVRGAVGWAVLGITIFNEVAPVIAQAQRNAHDRDVGTFLNDILFWQSTGMRVDVQGVDDNLWPFYDNEWTRDVSRVNELIKEDEISYLAMTAIPERKGNALLSNWDLFSLWAQSNIRNLSDWRAFITDNEAIRSEGEYMNDRQWSYRTGRISSGTFGIDLDIQWVHSEELTTILNATAEHVIEQSESEIREIEERPGGEYMQSAYHVGPPAHSHRALYSQAPQAAGLARFKSDISDPELYTLVGQHGRDMSPDMLFYRFPDSASPYPVPEGYVVVGGADFNSYSRITGTSNWTKVIGQDQYGNPYSYETRAYLEFFLAREEDLVSATRSD